MKQEWNNWIASLYEQSYPRLYRVAYRMTSSRETSKELVQDAFTLALVHREELLVHPQVEAWLMQTVVNLAKNECRRHSSTDVSFDILFHTAAPETQRSIQELLPAKLSPEDSQILIWRFEQELDYRQIADRLGISESSCRSRVSRVIEKCRRLLSFST